MTDAAPATKEKRPAIPIVIGVAGHRDPRPADVPALEAALDRVLAEFAEAYPNSPLVMMTSLAQGADTLAARVAKRRGVRIQAPLPMPEADYRASTSFDTEADRAEFDTWMKDETVERFVVPMPPAAGKPPGGWAAVANSKDPAPKQYRSQAYANAGAYLVLHCHVLVALWDGKDADPARPSGTAEHVLMKLLGRPHDRLLKCDEEPLGYRAERGPVIVLHTPRAKSDEPAGEAARREVRVPITVLNKEDEPPDPAREFHNLRDVRLAAKSTGRRFLKRVGTALGSPFARQSRTPQSEAEREVHQFQDICCALDDFNREVKAIPEARWKGRAKNVEAAIEPFKAGPHREWARRIAAVREVGAELANPLSKRLDIVQRQLFPVVAISVLLFHLYAHPVDSNLRNSEEHPGWSLVFSLVLLAVTALVVLRNWYARLDEQRLDYRALAEGFRVRLMWAIAGVGRSVASAYPGQLRSEVAWVRRALRTVCPPPPVWAEWFAELGPAEQRHCLESVRKKWVFDQKKFHIEHHELEHWWLPRCRTGGFGLALLGWLGLVVVCVLEWNHPSHLALVAASMAVVIGGLMIAFCERRAHEDLSKQYERMSMVFDAGLRELDACLARADVPGAQSIVETLGREAVAENASWVILRRSRPLELHVGG